MEKDTHIPIHGPSRHPHTPKPHGVESRRLYVQRIDEAVDPRVGPGRGRLEFRERARVGGGEDETLGGGEEGGGRGGGGVVSCEVVAEVAGGGGGAVGGVGVELRLLVFRGKMGV